MLFPFDPWLSGAIAADVAAASHAGAHALQVRRDHRLARLLLRAARDSPLYRRLLRGRDPERLRLRDLPVVHKAELMHQFDDWVADPAVRLDALKAFTADRARIAEPYLGRHVVWESSGSQGEPGVFIQDAHAMAVYDALEAQRRPVLRPLQRMLDPWGMAERIAFVGATGGHFASNVSMQRLRRLNPALRHGLRGISFLQPLRDVAAELQAFAPTVIASYPSVVVMLAEAKRSGRLRIAPKEIWTGGETLSPRMRSFVSETFGCPMANSYGASEFLSLAFECRHQRLHLNSDWAILEPVDELGRAVPEGEAGASTLLTNLANHVQPLIRYDLGDRVTLHSAPCRCGSSLPVVEVRGRDDDMLRLASSGDGTVSVPPLAITTVIEDVAGLFDFQLSQRGPDELLLTTGIAGADGRLALRRGRTVLAAFLVQQGAVGVRIRCRSGEPGHRGRSDKVQRIVATRD